MRKFKASQLCWSIGQSIQIKLEYKFASSSELFAIWLSIIFWLNKRYWNIVVRLWWCDQNTVHSELNHHSNTADRRWSWVFITKNLTKHTLIKIDYSAVSTLAQCSFSQVERKCPEILNCLLCIKTNYTGRFAMTLMLEIENILWFNSQIVFKRKFKIYLAYA